MKGFVKLYLIRSG